MKNVLKKQTAKAFGKKIYLLGEDADGIKYWLEEPKWDCGWYWGFGYIETYTNNNSPGCSKDISSHQHFSGFVGAQEEYSHEKQCFVKGEYVHNIYDNKTLLKTTFSENEGWKLSELFKQFYLLQEMAGFCYKDLPGCHVTTSPVHHGDLKDWYNKINKEMIPWITAKVMELLSPAEEVI